MGHLPLSVHILQIMHECTLLLHHNDKIAKLKQQQQVSKSMEDVFKYILWFCKDLREVFFLHRSKLGVLLATVILIILLYCWMLQCFM